MGSIDKIPTAFAAINVTATMRIMAIAMIKTCSTDPTAVILSQKAIPWRQGKNLDPCETVLPQPQRTSTWHDGGRPSDFRTTAVEPASAALA